MLRPEVIVVDNASSDGTAEIVKSFPGVVLVEEPTKGIVHARNGGFEESTSPLVANLDADTEMPVGWIERVLTEFERDPELVALSGPSVYHDLPPGQQLVVSMFYWAAVPVYF